MHSSRKLNVLNTLILFMLGLAAVLARPARAEKLDEARILGEADARIERIRKSDAVLRLTGPDGKPLPAGTSVQIEQTRHEFLFGCNLFGLVGRDASTINEDYARRFADLFNFATIPFYWWSYERQQGNVEYAQGRADRMTEWCLAHGITPKGHSLIYNLGDAPWFPEDKTALLDRQLERIKRDVGHFKGRIKVWDVANEITDFDRDSTRQKSPRLTAALRQAGAIDFVRQAFELTHATDPAAKLLINDYKLDDGYANNVIAKLTGTNGKPLYDAIGLQAHQHGKPWPVMQVWNTCERFSKFDMPLHVTEVTICSGRKDVKINWETQRGPAWPTTPEGEANQARDVVRFYTTLFSHPAVEAITWWDLSDRGAWLGAPAGLVRQDMSPKPAYEELMKLVKGKWWTKETKAVEEGGSVKMRGFRGDYRVTVKGKDGKTMTGTFTLKRGLGGPVEVKLAEIGK